MKAEAACDIKVKVDEEDAEIDIDALIAKLRSNGTFQNIEQIQATLQPIIHKISGSRSKEEKLEAFLREVIAQNNRLAMVKTEQNAIAPPHFGRLAGLPPTEFKGQMYCAPGQSHSMKYGG